MENALLKKIHTELQEVQFTQRNIGRFTTLGKYIKWTRCALSLVSREPPTISYRMFRVHSTRILAWSKIFRLLATETLASSRKYPIMTTFENKITVEILGCIICARFNMLTGYNPDSRLVDCTVTSLSGHRVTDEQRPLIACDSHTAKGIEIAYKRWQFRNGKEPKNE